MAELIAAYVYHRVVRHWVQSCPENCQVAQELLKKIREERKNGG